MEGVIGEDSDDDVIFAYRVTTVAIPMRDILTLVTSVPFQLGESKRRKGIRIMHTLPKEHMLVIFILLHSLFSLETR